MPTDNRPCDGQVFFWGNGNAKTGPGLFVGRRVP